MKNKLIIVYQFGKVGSTSLVASLNALENVTAYQSHFLGKIAFGQILHILLDPDTSDYFFEHNLGQLSQNIRTQRAIDMFNRQQDEIFFLSLAREPLDWYRSAVSQDLVGTLEGFKLFATENGNSNQPIYFTLNILKDEIKHLFSSMTGEEIECNSTPMCVKTSLNYLKEKYGDSASIIHKQLMIFFRPFSWFNEHYKTYTGLEIIIDDENVFNLQNNNFNYLVARYEDFNDIESLIAKYWDIYIDKIQHKNVSHFKQGADRIKEIVSKWNNDATLTTYLSKTSYCQQFRYHQP